MIPSKNSSDLDVGRRPELKSDEFFVWNPIVIEIISRLFEIVGVTPRLGYMVLQKHQLSPFPSKHSNILSYDFLCSETQAC